MNKKVQRIILSGRQSGKTQMAKEIGDLLAQGYVYEQDLPEMTDDQYNEWYSRSKVVYGVRMGKLLPKMVFPENLRPSVASLNRNLLFEEIMFWRNYYDITLQLFQHLAAFVSRDDVELFSYGRDDTIEELMARICTKLREQNSI